MSFQNANPDEADLAESGEAEPAEDPRDARIVLAPDQKDVWEHSDAVTSLDDAMAQILAAHEADGARSDLVIKDLAAWLFAAGDGAACVYPRDGSGVYDLRRTAFAHLCERAKAPPKYLRSIPARYVVPSLNWGIANVSKGPALLRVVDDGLGLRLRAVLSDQYATFDDVVVLPQLRTALAAVGVIDDVVARVVATGLTTLMRLSLPSEAVSLPSGEAIEVALDLTNGEVGNRSVALSPTIYFSGRKYAVRGQGLRLYHRGPPEKLAETFRREIPEILVRARDMKLKINVALDRTIGSVDLIEEAEKLRSLGLTVADAREVCRVVAEGQGLKLPHDTAEWEDVIKAQPFTARAFDVLTAIASLGDGDKGVDRRLSLEEAAAKYLARIR